MKRKVLLRQLIKLIMVNLLIFLIYSFLIFAGKKTNSQPEEYHNNLTQTKNNPILLEFYWINLINFRNSRTRKFVSYS
jgi:hypothetical protein